MKKTMTIGAVLAVSGGILAAGLGPQSYVQDGLVTHFDAIDNEGTGTHNPSAAKWIDLKGSASITLQTGASWTDRYLDSGTTLHTIKSMPAYDRTSLTMEVPINVISNGPSSGYPRIFANAEPFSIYFTGTGSQASLYINGQTPDVRPSFTNFRLGTIYVYSDSVNYGIGLDGVWKADSGQAVTQGIEKPAADWTLNGGYSYYYLHGHYHGMRFYNRSLSSTELRANAAVDGLRFFSYTYAGTGASENWSDLAWTAPEKATGTAPSTLTNEYAQVKNAAVSVAASDDIGLAGLSLEDGATLDVAAGAVVSLKVLYVEGAAVPRGIYTGGDAAWLAGAGTVRVAGAPDAAIPHLVPTPAADGWYEFGLASGYAHDYATGWSATAKYHYIIGDRPIWDDYAFPAGAKLRLVGGILLETVPAGVFSQYDTSGLKIVYLHGATAFADGTALTVPSGAIFRYQPGTWKPDASVANKWWLTSNGSDTVTYTGDIANNGQMNVTGDGTQSPFQIYTGRISGNGNYYSTNFGKQGRFQGRYDMVGTLSGFQCGSLIWLDTLSVGGKFTSASFGSCGDKWATDSSWCANGLLFGKDNSDATADNELKIDTLTGNGYSTTGSDGKRWRRGGHVIVWGNNTVHVGELKNGLHVMAWGGDQDCSKGWLSKTVGGKGTGNIIIDKFTNGNLYLSTNINAKVGQVVAASTFDYTYQSGAINRMTLDITNGCHAAATVLATDIGMLPARLSGFAGTVTLTDTATKAWTMPVDFTQGTNSLYNTVGCIGSGTLGSAPAAGSIDVTFPTTGDAPVKGEYALARFTSGGDKLAGWTVTLNGQAVSSMFVRGMEVKVVKDATGLWLDVDKPGLAFIIR